MEKSLTKQKAYLAAKELMSKISELEKQYGLSLNSDTGDIYLSYREDIGEGKQQWSSVKLYWEGNGTGVKVFDEESKKRFIFLAKLGIVESNNSADEFEVQRIDDPSTFMCDNELDFEPPQLVNDEQAQAIFKSISQEQLNNL